MFDKALRRKAVAKELYETELNYIANLKLLSDFFIAPLQASCTNSSLTVRSSGELAIQPIVSEDELKTLFSSALVLAQFQELFAAKLKEKVDAWHYEQTVGDAVTFMVPYMRLYGDYITNFSYASELLLRLSGKKDPKNKQAGNLRFRAFLECAYQNPTVMNIGELDSFLVQPVQRLPRYKIFLDQLIKLTAANHEDYPALNAALQEVSEVMNYINEKKRSQEQEHHVFRVYDLIEPAISDLIAPGRALLLEGHLHWTRSLKEPRILCQAFLFSDLLLIAKIPKDEKKLKLLARFDIRSMIIPDVLFHEDLADKSHQKEPSTDRLASPSRPRAATVSSFSPSAEKRHTLRPAEPCYCITGKYEGEPYFCCWDGQEEANNWRTKMLEAQGKVAHARETNPTTSEGKAHAFKTKVTKFYLNASSTSDAVPSSSSPLMSSAPATTTPATSGEPRLRKFAEHKLSHSGGISASTASHLKNSRPSKQ